MERRARLETVDGRRPGGEFWLAPACHELTVRYEETYIINHGGVFIFSFNPTVAAVGAAVAVGTVAASTEIRRYDTATPIRFFVLARPGVKYWLTSSFDGDVFHARLAVLNAQNERIAVILPEQPCSAQAQ